MTVNVLTHLMFEGDAEEAMRWYASLVPDSEVVALQLYEEGEYTGKVLQGKMRLGGREFICIDSPVKHEFTFTPAMSIFLEFDAKPELERCFNSLSTGGKVMMPLDNYGFSPLFGWVVDRFGVSWQLNLLD